MLEKENIPFLSPDPDTYILSWHASYKQDLSSKRFIFHFVNKQTAIVGVLCEQLV